MENFTRKQLREKYINSRVMQIKGNIGTHVCLKNIKKKKNTSLPIIQYYQLTKKIDFGIANLSN